MFLEDLLNKLEADSPRTYYAFETFILNLLKIHQEKNKRHFERQPRRIGFDAFAADGIDNITGPTQIEIKFNLSRVPFYELLNQILYTTHKSELEEFSNLLIITPFPIPEKVKSKLEEALEIKNLPFKIITWGPGDINKIINKNKKEAFEIANNLFSLRVESAVAQGSSNWQEERKEKVELVRSLYRKGQFSFFLGAGVSSSAGMPDWNTLLNSLFVTYLTNELDQDFKVTNADIEQIVFRLNEIDEPSALMAARYIRKGLTKDLKESRDFINTVTKNLYSLRNKQMKIGSDLIRAIGDMCIPKRTGARIRAVVTYNFDDLIERQLKTQSIQFKSIYTDNDFIDPDELPIYHVHGFLPEDSNDYKLLDKSTLVFSEEGYHQIYADPYHWSNLVQLSHLRENHCLMVGLSMTDPNLRRLLDIGSRNSDEPKHFAFMKRIITGNFTHHNNEQVISNVESVETFLKRHHNLNEEIMRELGVSIIWYTEYEEIPQILNQILS